MAWLQSLLPKGRALQQTLWKRTTADKDDQRCCFLSVWSAAYAWLPSQACAFSLVPIPLSCHFGRCLSCAQISFRGSEDRCIAYLSCDNISIQQLDIELQHHCQNRLVTESGPLLITRAVDRTVLCIWLVMLDLMHPSRSVNAIVKGHYEYGNSECSTVPLVAVR